MPDKYIAVSVKEKTHETIQMVQAVQVVSGLPKKPYSDLYDEAAEMLLQKYKPD